MRNTYERKPAVDDLKQADNIGELEDGQPAMFVDLEIILKTHEEADGKVCGSYTAEEDQYFLADEEPWRVTDTKKDRLATVRNMGRRLAGTPTC